MVESRHFVWIVVISSLISPVVFGDSTIRSVRVASESTVRIKPCEPVWVLLDVTVESSPDQEKMREIPPELARRVVVNGRNYDPRMSRVNAVAIFSLNRSSIKQIDDESKSFQTVVLLYWNPEDEGYLFNESGLYKIELYPQAYVEVVVEEPTKEEQMIISEMRNLGLEFAMFLIDPGDNRLAKLFAPRAEEMLEKYSDTAYAKHLSVALGMVRLRLVRHEAHRRPDFDPKSLAQEQVIAAKKYFEPYCKGEIKSLHQAGAAYELAAKVLNRLRYEPEDASEESAAARREAKMLLEKVKNSPYSLDYAVKAAAELRELGD